MNLFHILLLLFLIVPLVEIYFLIQVGSVIGALPTIFLVVFTAVLGVSMLRIQGFATLSRLRGTLAQGGIPALEMLEGALLLVAGALLLTPGFFTDAIGFVCLVPPWRRALVRWFLGRFLLPTNSAGNGGARPRQAPRGSSGGRRPESHHIPRTFEGEYRREDD